MIPQIIQRKSNRIVWDPEQILYKPDSEDTSRKITLEDLANFTKSYETYKDSVYRLKENPNQDLAGYGSTNKNILNLARTGRLTEPIAAKQVLTDLKDVQDTLSKSIPNWSNLSNGVQMALIETGYNLGSNKLVNESPNLMNMLRSGITDPKQLVKEMDHNKSSNSWLGARSAARRAMALNEYDWDHKEIDKYGRQVDSTLYKGPEDWKSSPYFGKYKFGGMLKRIK